MAATNQVVGGIALQSAEGDPADAPQFRFTISGNPDVGPNVETGQREETGNTRDGGDTVVTGREVQGSFSTILRPTTAPLFYYCVLGAKAVSGAGPYNHTITAADGDQPWVTLWMDYYGVLVEKYADCKLTTANMTAGIGQNVGDLVAQFGVVGKDYSDITASATFNMLDAADGTAGVFDNTSPIRWYGSTHARAAVGGGSSVDITSAVDQVTNNIAGNQNAAQTTLLTSSKIEPGTRRIEHSYQQVGVATIEPYKRAVYGSATATTPGSNLDEAQLTHVFKDGAGTTRLTMTIPRYVHATAELPVDPNGDIGRIQAQGFALRPTTATPIETCLFVNTIATYPNAS